MAHTFRFGAFEVDVTAGELRKGGMKIKLQDQPFRVLGMLLERPGQVLMRDEIRQRLWPADTFVDFDHSVNTAITRLREALGDSADNPRFIETLPKKGYRFIAPVEELGTPAPVAAPQAPVVPVEPSPLPPLLPPPPGPAQWRLWFWRILMAALAMAALYLYVADWRLRKAPGVHAGRIMLAVLPFEDMSDDSSQASGQAFSNGQTEEVISRLGRLNPARLGVIARTSAMVYKNSNKKTDQIARELGVDYVLEGSVRRSGDKVRIIAKLIQSDQTLRWTQTYERPTTDILMIQSEVAAAIADEIRIELEPQSHPRAVNPEAYEACLNGRYFWNLRTEEGLHKSVDSLQLAIRKDPQYPLAHAWLADAYNLLGYYSILPPKEAYPQAMAAAKRALELDDNLAEAHASLADVDYIFEWDWPAAEREFKRALSLNPSYASAHHWYADYLESQGRFEESKSELDKARALDPLSPLIDTDAGFCLYTARQTDQAIELYRKTIERYPSFPLAHSWMGMAAIQKKSFDEAIAELQKGAELSGGSPNAIALLGYGYAAAGHRKEAQETLQALENAARHRYVSPICFALVYVALDDRAKAFEWAEKAFEHRAGWLARLKVEPLLDGIRPDPRFQNLMKKVGLF